MGSEYGVRVGSTPWDKQKCSQSRQALAVAVWLCKETPEVVVLDNAEIKAEAMLGLSGHSVKEAGCG